MNIIGEISRISSIREIHNILVNRLLIRTRLPMQSNIAGIPENAFIESPTIPSVTSPVASSVLQPLVALQLESSVEQSIIQESSSLNETNQNPTLIDESSEQLELELAIPGTGSVAENQDSVPERTIMTPEEKAAIGNTGVTPPLMSNAYNPVTPATPDENPVHEMAIEEIAPSEASNNESQISNLPLENKSALQQQPQGNTDVLTHFDTVSKRASWTNQVLERRRLPYRFRVYTLQDQRVLIDLSVFNDRGEQTRKITRDITEENFGKIIDDVTDGKGLFLDSAPPNSTYYK